MCWNTLYLTDGCETLYPDIANEFFVRADKLCTDNPPETAVPTPFPTHEECNQTEIDDGSHVLMSIDAAYEILDEICNVIGSDNIALLDGGYIYGSDCTAEKTDEVKTYTVMYCASAADYCDFEDLLLSPNFDVDVDTTLVLVELAYLLQSKWGIDEWGFDITMTRSLALNAVGIYMNHLAFTDYLVFYVENESGQTLTENLLP